MANVQVTPPKTNNKKKLVDSYQLDILYYFKGRGPRKEAAL